MPAVTKFARPVAFLHTRAFREDLRTVEPYGNRYYLPLKTGAASQVISINRGEGWGES